MSEARLICLGVGDQAQHPREQGGHDGLDLVQVRSRLPPPSPSGRSPFAAASAGVSSRRVPRPPRAWPVWGLSGRTSSRPDDVHQNRRPLHHHACGPLIPAWRPQASRAPHGERASDLVQDPEARLEHGQGLGVLLGRGETFVDAALRRLPKAECRPSWTIPGSLLFILLLWCGVGE